MKASFGKFGWYANWFGRAAAVAASFVVFC